MWLKPNMEYQEPQRISHQSETYKSYWLPHCLVVGIPTPLIYHGVKVSWDLMKFPI